MATFETRPVRKEAYRFREQVARDLVRADRGSDVFAASFPGVGFTRWGLTQVAFHVTTAHNQQVTLADGDWISPEPDGRGHYPIKDDIFRLRHDPVCTCTVSPAVARCSHHPDCAFAQIA